MTSLFENLSAWSRVYEGFIHRNIFTCSPSQSLLDDVCDDQEATIVDAVVQLTSGVDHHRPQWERPFQYGAVDSIDILAVFEKHRWNIGRFGDGLDYGVWYAAEDVVTSLYEGAWTAYRLAKDNVLSRGEVYTTDRSLFRAQVKADRAVDAMASREDHSVLSHTTDYSFCQKLGRRLVAENYELLRTPSARRVGGVCTPVFSKNIFRRIDYQATLSMVVRPDGKVFTLSQNPEWNLSLDFSF